MSDDLQKKLQEARRQYQGGGVVESDLLDDLADSTYPPAKDLFAEMLTSVPRSRVRGA